MNTITSLLLKELDNEMQPTRAMLQRVANEHLTWQPHPKSMTIQQLITHIGEIPGWPYLMLTSNEIDFADNPHKPVIVESKLAALAALESYYDKGRNALAQATDEQLLNETWTMRAGNYEIGSPTRYEAIRMAIDQLIHHRAQLGVFLRLLNVPIAGPYGPSADEMEAFGEAVSA